MQKDLETGIAVIGMSGRFPGAPDVAAFWENLKHGVDTISRFQDEELEFTNDTPENRRQGAKIVKARAILEHAEMFDAAFFGIYPREAELMDPQHRVFLECAWEALESAGYDSEAYAGLIGVYAGLSLNTYLLNNLVADRAFAENFAGAYQVGSYSVLLGNEKDFMPTRVSYKLNLRGPSMDLQTACSTSLVAVSQACLSLLNYQSDMALAGGVSISFPQKRDYIYQEDGMVSVDGTCRTFDAKAQGTVFGHGAGVVLLKRYAEAVADGDNILAVIRGSAVNNDGSVKIGYAAPSVQSQADVIAMALAAAGVEADTISYVEAHGTGTPLGDPIEVAALTKAFRLGTQAKGFCALGTAKTNIGHLDAAAGVAGLIKTILSLQHGLLPPILNFTSPNPRIDFADSPFYPVTKLTEWKRGAAPRRAGVSAFGVGGTNAHVILEEPPAIAPTEKSRANQLLLLSAKSPAALDRMTANLAAHLAANPGMALADAAFTLQCGRRRFSHCRMLVCGDPADAVAALTASEGKRLVTRHECPDQAGVVFMFPGQGSQYPNMGLELYETERVFRAEVDRCAEILRPELGLDLRAVLYPARFGGGAAALDINQTALAQPAIATVEYALAKLWLSWGIQPVALVGHSIGEYVAACLAGVFTPEDAFGLLAKRARLMQSLPSGSMLAVRLPAEEVRPKLTGTLSLAAINGPAICVVSGPTAELEAFQKELGKTASKFLATSHAFHSAMMDPILEPFAALAAQVHRGAPTIPWLSTLTGKWVTAEDMADANYWSRQVRQTVRLTDAFQEIIKEPRNILLEVGPGQTLSPLARQQPGKSAAQTVLASLPQSPEAGADTVAVLGALGQLWLGGATVDWKGFYQDETRRRVPLPTYPFERKRYWVEPVKSGAPAAAATRGAETNGAEQELTADAGATVAPEPVPPSGATRKELIVAQVKALLKELSGLGAEIETGVSFLELGFDSLFLTQASTSLQQKFGVKITFRQLLNDLPSVAALADYLEAKLPADAVIGAASAPAAKPATAGSADAAKQSVIKAAAPAPAPVETEFKRFGPFKPIEKGTLGGLTPRQQKHLDELIARYTRKTPGSKNYTAENRRHFADPRAVAGFKSNWKEMVYPIVAERSSGSRIWDVDGNEFVDLTMGFGLNFFGHSPAFVTDAVMEQLKLGVEIGPQNALAGKVAALLCEFTGMERATFCNTGSEAVMAAMRLARTVTGRKRIAIFSGDYHGMFDEVLVRPSWVNGEYRSSPIAPGIPPSLVENMLVLEYGSPASLEILRAHAHELAAIMVEPVQSRRPDLQPREFLHELRALTEKTGSALIFDEVVTGFRCHPGGAQAVFGVKADLATYGKVVGGGIPIGVLAGKAQYMDALDGGDWRYGDDSFPEAGVTFFAGTFVRHPLAMAAAWAVLNHLKREGPSLQSGLNARVAAFTASLNAHFAEIHVPIRLPHFSSFFVVDHAHDLKLASLLWFYLREKGVHIWEGRPCFFTLAHTDADMERIALAFKESVAEMQRAGFLPETPSAAELAAMPRAGGVRLTEAQKEIWLSAQMSQDANCSYNESNTLHFEGELNVPALRQSLQALADRHEALRTTFSHDGQSQEFAPALKLDVPLLDFSTLEPSVRDARVAGALAAEAATPFNLERGPLVRMRLLKLSPSSHLLVMTEHHMVCDGWSFGVLIWELNRLYNEAVGGEKSPLPPAMQFSDYVRLLESDAQVAEKAAAQAYWLKQFAEPAPILELPADHARPPVKTYRGSMLSRVIDAERFKELKKVSAQRRSTLFATLLAAFETLLHRLSGQNDLVVGIPAAGQAPAGSNELVGHCLNFLPTRSRLSGTMSFLEFSAQVKQTVLDAYDHQNYTYGTLVQALKPARDTSRLPLVSVMFNIDKSGLDRLNFAGLKFDITTNPKSFVNFDIFFNLIQTDDNLEVECEFNTDLYDPATIRRWLAHYETLIQGIIDDPAKPLDELPLLNEAERHQILTEWNQTEAVYPADETVHGLFEKQAALTPDAVAVVFAGQKISYAELNRRADELASRLKTAGVQSGVMTGLFTQRSAEMVVGMLGILKAGGAYVPMDPTFPRERLAAMAEDSRMPVIVTVSALADQLPAHQAVVVVIDSPATNLQLAQVATSATAEDLAYVIFTSGSTGRPKGVQIPHRAVVNFLTSMRREPGMTAADVLVAVTTLSFDIAGLEIFLPLTTGACVVVADADTVRDGTRLASLLAESKATVMQATPATWRLLLEAGWNGGSKFKVLVGGEACPRELAVALVARAGSVWNMYGPTETTIWSATGQLSTDAGPVSIGRPIANTRIYIASPGFQPAPIGVPGELLIGGDGLARGYLGLPELTAEKFIADPFRDEAGERVYRTGDLARYLPDGRIECLGREDHQVKIRGFRIELGEIETALGRHPDVRENVVVAREDAHGQKRLAAYVALANGRETDAAALREHLLRSLPDYMTPAAFVFLAELPRTPNGKIDRKVLPAPEAQNGRRDQTFIAPRNPVEQTLAGIWAEVLGVKRVSVDDDLFNLGADSIHIFQIIARSNQAGLKVVPTELLGRRNIAALAAAIGPVKTDARREGAPVIRRVSRDPHRLKRTEA